MGEALFPKAQRGYVKIHRWKQYEVNSLTTYKWNRWNLVSTTVYKWKRYNVNQPPKYTLWRTNDTKYIYSHGANLTGYKSFSINTAASTFIGEDIFRGTHPSTIYPFYWTLYSSSGNHGIACITSDLGWTQANSWDSEYGFYYNGYSLFTNGNSGGYQTTIQIGSPSIGSYIDQTTSTNSGAYPSNGISGSYWYVSAGSEIQYSKGSTQYADVTSTDPNAYPNGNHDGSYWYDNRTSETSYSQGAYITDVISTDPNAYPSNGISGSYWYVYDGVS